MGDTGWRGAKLGSVERNSAMRCERWRTYAARRRRRTSGQVRPALARRVRRLEGSASTPTILEVLSVAEAAEKIGRNPETVRRWIRSGRLPARRVGRHHEIEAGDLRRIEDELFPMAELPDEWKVGDDGSPAPNWVAALHRSRSGH